MSGDQPNLLFFLPDQHRFDWLGYNPDLPLRTPAIDRLAATGTRFDRAFCTSPLCAPSRASLASGRGYDRCGVQNNQHNYPLQQPTYYQALRDAGYRVAGVGKFDLHKDISDPASLDWHLDGSRLLTEWGFTEGVDNEGKLDGSNSYRASGGPRGPYLAFLRERGLEKTYVREHDESERHLSAYTTALPDDAYCDNWLSEKGLRFLQSFPEHRPWHLVVNFVGPHSPMDVTESIRKRWEHVDLPPPHHSTHPDREALLRARRYYAAMIENIDRQVGRFIYLVAARGELENTVIVYASDHGEMLGDHGRWGKTVWYHPSVGVPLIVAGTGVVRGQQSSALVSLHDLAATFEDYAGASPMPEMDARSIRPLLEGQITVHRTHVHSGLDHWRLVFDGTHKLVVLGNGAPLLFDLQSDPLERQSIAAIRPDIVERLQRVLREEKRDWRPLGGDHESPSAQPVG